jgi:hypothetical protein
VASALGCRLADLLQTFARPTAARGPVSPHRDCTPLTNQQVHGRMRMLRGCLLFLVLACAGAFGADPRPRNVILVTIDGLRWQEVFRGAEEAFFTKEAGGVPVPVREALRRDFWAATPAERRQKLMPFFWSTVLQQGQVYGNRDAGSRVSVSNPQWISYPGYNEILTGAPSSVVVTNALIPNPHVTVLGWLNTKPAFAGRVAVCADWMAFKAIVNEPRSRIPVWTSRHPTPPELASPRMREIEQWMQDVQTVTPEAHSDGFVNAAARDVLERKRPRVFLLAFGETDGWAHERRYDRYLYAVQHCDRFVRELWEWLQSQPDYRDNTTLLLTPDHGRGVEASDWISHGTKAPWALTPPRAARCATTRSCIRRKLPPRLRRCSVRTFARRSRRPRHRSRRCFAPVDASDARNLVLVR